MEISKDIQPDNETQKSILQALTSASLEGSEKVKALPKDEASKEVIVDSLWCLIGVVADDEKEKYVSILNEVLNDSESNLDDQMAMTRLNLEVLQRYTDRFSGIDPALIRKKIIKENTNQIYRQRKFNLFREESEGFAKLLRSLCKNPVGENGNEQIKGLIGLFELDPIRVADTVFGSLIYKVNAFSSGNKQQLDEMCSAEIQYLKEIRHIQHLIGMTLPTTNSAFFQAVALLLKHEVTSLPLLLPHFMFKSFDVQHMVKNTSEYYSNLIQALKKFGPSSVLPVHELHDEEDHPIFLLLDALLEESCWDDARAVFLHLFSLEIDPFVCKPDLIDCIRSYLSSLVDHVYCGPNIDITGSSALDQPIVNQIQVDSMLGFFEKFMSIMEVVQHVSIFKNQDVILTKIVATLRCIIGKALVIPHKMNLFKVLLHCASTLGRPNVQISFLLWDILSYELSWQDRYCLYNEAWEWGSGNIRTLQSRLPIDFKNISDILMNSFTGQKPLPVIISLITTSYRASHFLKRTSSENIKSMAPTLAKVAGLTSPLSAIKVLINIVGNYENMGELMIEGMQFWGDLGRDVAGYELRWRLINNPTTGAQVGFQAFLASFYRAYGSVEVDGILEFLYNDIGKGNLTNVELLRGLLSVAGGMPSWSSQSPLQLYAQAGGSLLQNATTSFGKTMKSQTSGNAANVLRSKLMPYGVNLAARLARLRETVVFTENTKQLAMYDSITGLMFKLIDFLQVDLSEWLKLFSDYKNLDILNLDRGVMFSLIRPVLQNNPECGFAPKLENIIESQFYRHTLGDIYCPNDLYEDEISNLVGAKGDELKNEMEFRNKYIEKKIELLKIGLSGFSLQDFDIGLFLGCHILPRALLTSCDAIYCSKFLQLLVGTCSLEMELVYTKLFSYICGFLYSMTVEEANNFGLFLFDTWSHISSLRYKDVPIVDIQVFDRWHSDLACNLIMGLLSLEELISRVALKLLIRLVSVYPTKAHVGEIVLKKLEPIQKEESSNKALANSYFGQLIKARNDGIWREEDSKIENEREEQERVKLEERRKRLRLQDEALAAEVANYDSKFPNDRERDRGRPQRREMGDRDRKTANNAPKFIPRSAPEPESRVSTSSRGQSEGLEDRWQRKGVLPEKKSISSINGDEANKRKRSEPQVDRSTRSGGYTRDRDRNRGYNR